MTEAVILDNVSKVFDAGTPQETLAVDRLSLSLRHGEIFSLVGPDGAGKTTILRMMCGVLAPTSGDLRVCGFDARTQREEIKRRIGYLSQRFSLYGDLSIDENIDFFAEIHRVEDYALRKEELLRFTRLAPFRDRLAERLSGGMKQKLALACTLIHRPEVIFLDEPTTGVDPVSRRDFWKILAEVLRSGISIVMTTPYLDEAERSARVALINEGRLLICDTPEHVKASFGHQVCEVTCRDPRAAHRSISSVPGILDAQLFGDRLHVVLEHHHPGPELLMNDLRERGIEVFDARSIIPSLEDVFISRMSTR